jgi:hypothetical protein
MKLLIPLLILALAGCSSTPGTQPKPTDHSVPPRPVLEHLFALDGCQRATVTSDVPTAWAQGKLPAGTMALKGNTPTTALLESVVFTCKDTTASLTGIAIQHEGTSLTRTFVYLLEATTQGNQTIGNLTGQLLNQSTAGTISASLANPVLTIQVQGTGAQWMGTGVSVPYTANPINHTMTFLTQRGLLAINGVGTLQNFASTFVTQAQSGQQTGAYPNERIPGLAQTSNEGLRLNFTLSPPS